MAKPPPKPHGMPVQVTNLPLPVVQMGTGKHDITLTFDAQQFQALLLNAEQNAGALGRMINAGLHEVAEAIRSLTEEPPVRQIVRATGVGVRQQPQARRRA